MGAYGWYRKSAEAGDEWGMTLLGLCYEQGTSSVLEAEGNRSRMGRGSLSNPTQQEIFHWIFPQFSVEIPSKFSEFSRNFQWKFAAFPLEN